jgi:hypothetical protein
MSASSSERPGSGRALASLRLGLGLAQMFGAALGFVLLCELGLSRTTIGVAAATTALSLVSNILFRGTVARRS